MDIQTRATLDKIKEQLADAAGSILFEDDETIKERYYSQMVNMKQDGVIKDFHLEWNGRTGTALLKLADTPEFVELEMNFMPISGEVPMTTSSARTAAALVRAADGLEARDDLWPTVLRILDDYAGVQQFTGEGEKAGPKGVIGLGTCPEVEVHNEEG